MIGIQSYMNRLSVLKTSDHYIEEPLISNIPLMLNPSSMSSSSSSTSNSIALSIPIVSNIINNSEPNIDIDHVPIKSKIGRVIRSSKIDEQYCKCGCKYSTPMIKCKGGTRRILNTKCQKLLRLQCVPTWLCDDCTKLDRDTILRNINDRKTTH